MRYAALLLSLLLWSTPPASAQLSIGVAVPGVSIGLSLPLYPHLERVPGYPVYYAPRLQANFFFYDGMYWVYQYDDWYASTWYDGPWMLVEPQYVPLYVLRVPVRYYRSPPQYFGGWRVDRPPRWGDHWGRDWERERSGWDRWNRRAAPPPAPLPTYQRRYSGERYPQAQEQRDIQSRNYRYRPRDRYVRPHFEAQAGPREPMDRRGPQAAPRQQDRPEQWDGRGRDESRPAAPIQRRADERPGPPVHEQRQRPDQGPDWRGQTMPRMNERHDRPDPGAAPPPARGQGQDKSRRDKERDKERGDAADERGQGRNR